jgi:hypothetical protein
MFLIRLGPRPFRGATKLNRSLARLCYL